MNMFKISSKKLDKEEEAIIKCKLTRDDIKRYIKRLEKNELLKKNKAKESLKSKDRDRAKMYLQQSKFYKEQINIANGQLSILEDQIMQIESAKQMKNAIKVLEDGNKILKQLNQEVNIEKWEKITDDMNEMKQQQDEIGNFLRNHSIDQSEYNEAVDRELEALMELELPDAGLKDIQSLKEKKEYEKKNNEKQALEI